MCGIGGYRAFGDEKPTGTELTNLLVESENRGQDATGVAFTENNALQILKNGVRASEFVKSSEWIDIISGALPNTMILHCRAGTGGSANDNRNNHPIFNKKGMALIHNGVISNHKELAKERKIKLDGEVDSEVILKLIEPDWWGSIKNLNELTGGFACATIYAAQPNDLVLFRHTNPIVFHMDKERDILFWASTKAILKASLVKYHRGFPCSDISTFDMEDDSAMLIDEHGIKDITEINPRVHYAQSYSWDKDTNSWRSKGESCGRQQQGNFRGEKKKEGKEKAGKETSPCGVTNCETGEMDTCDSCKCRSQFLKNVGDNKKYCFPCILELSRSHSLYCSDCYGTLNFVNGIEKAWCAKCQKHIGLEDVRVWSGRYFNHSQLSYNW